MPGIFCGACNSSINNGLPKSTSCKGTTSHCLDNSPPGEELLILILIPSSPVEGLHPTITVCDSELSPDLHTPCTSATLLCTSDSNSPLVQLRLLLKAVCTLIFPPDDSVSFAVQLCFLTGLQQETSLSTGKVVRPALTLQYP